MVIKLKQTQNAFKMLATCPSKYNKRSSNNMDVLFVGNQNIEGYTNYTDNGPGKNYVKPGSCPDGFTKDKNGCRQVCTHCNYRDDEPESRYMNEYDICGPDGRYQGFNYYGYTVCLNKKDNKLQIRTNDKWEYVSKKDALESLINDKNYQLDKYFEENTED